MCSRDKEIDFKKEKKDLIKTSNPNILMLLSIYCSEEKKDINFVFNFKGKKCFRFVALFLIMIFECYCKD